MCSGDVFYGAVALAECAMGDGDNMIGAVVEGLESDIRADALLFGETQSRVILSCGKRDVKKIEKIARKNKTPFKVIGTCAGKRLRISCRGRRLIDLSLKDMHKAWSTALEEKISAVYK